MDAPDHHPDSTPSEVSPPSPAHSDLFWPRVSIYFHVGMIMVTALCSAKDRGLLRLPDLPSMILDAVILVALISLLVCPIVTLILAAQLHTRSKGFRITLAAGGVFLGMVQMWTMLPMVQ